MTSPVSICNRALAIVGANLISSLEDNTVEARTCNSLYSEIYEEVLTSKPWTFATKRMEIERVSNDALFGDMARFQIPNTSKHVHWAVDDPSIDPRRDPNNLVWYAENGHVVADTGVTRLFIWSTIATPESNVSSLFRSAVVYRLANDLAYALSASKPKADRFMEKYEGMLARAYERDSQMNKSAKMRHSSKLTGVRR